MNKIFHFVRISLLPIGYLERFDKKRNSRIWGLIAQGAKARAAPVAAAGSLGRWQFGLAVSCNILSETIVSVDAPSAIFPAPLRKISKMSLILWRHYNNTYKTLIITTLLITLINATLRICFCLMFYG